jgi:carbonic anhydrase/acetyltransferase-like protein (isoleucine patch superfamily)
MPLFEFEGRSPDISPHAWIAPTATLVGDVRVEAEASVWYGAVLRADFGPIIVRRGANIQDGSVLHGGADPVTEVGAGATVGHLCVVHGAVIGEEALIGNGATVLDGAIVGSRALVAAGCTVPPGMTVPAGMLAAGVPAGIAGEVRDRRCTGRTNPATYRDLARRCRCVAYRLKAAVQSSPASSDVQTTPLVRARRNRSRAYLSGCL